MYSNINPLTRKEAKKYRRKSAVIVPNGITKIGDGAFCDFTTFKMIL